ncbi:cell wall-binding repeat-containing protein [Mesobacillus jeotgali]|uniref:cell wall-binding repeat-containing protein n=1 Tax=Mesobacillus jeotgali TaxID=129985 RepID=UPI000C849053|nr:cell wall-binding repeat-containing protein [Mesobacillus jeotgali]
MSKIKFSALLVFLLTLTGFVAASSQASAVANYERIAGSNRVDTSVQISNMGWEQADSVILARADNPADALSSASLSGALDAPILLTYPNKISQSVIDEIDRLGAANVYILGGTAAISSTVEAALDKLELNTIRVNGKNRFETAANINKKAGSSLGTKAIVVNGFAVADALSASSNSAINQIPIYLANKTSLPVNLPANIKEVLIYGGEGVVGKQVAQYLQNQGKKVTRIAGSNRYMTNLAAADPSLGNHVIIVRGISTSPTSEEYPDAVAGAGLSHKIDANIILTHPDTPVSATLDYFNKNRYWGYFILGGEKAVSTKTAIDLSFHPDSKVLKTFGQNIIASAMDPLRPVLYSLSDDDNSLHSYNYVTGEQKSIKFNDMPEQLYVANNKVYVTLVHGEHDDYWFDDQSGGIAVVNAEQFRLEKQFEIALDPFDIVVDQQGFIYVSGGSGQWTELKSYSGVTGEELSGERIYQQGYLELSPNQSKIYSIDTGLSPRDISEYYISGGMITGEKDSPYHGDYDLGDFHTISNIKVSPDGKYLFNNMGHVFKGNLDYAAELWFPYEDLAFDLDQNRFFTGISSFIFKHDYSDFMFNRYYQLNGELEAIYQKDGKLYVLSLLEVSSTGLQRYALEQLDPAKGVEHKINTQSTESTEKTLQSIMK